MRYSRRSRYGARTARSQGRSALESPFFSFAALWMIDWLLTIPHELAHALTARFAGLQDIRIIIGMGRPIASTTALGFKWLFNRIPFGGFTLVGQNTAVSRGTYTLVVLAGPGVSGIAMVVTWLLCRANDSWISLTKFSGIFFWANAMLFVQSTFPHYFDLPQGRTPNDGMIIWKLWFQRTLYGAQNNLESRARVLRAIHILVFCIIALALLTIGVSVLIFMTRESPAQAMILGAFFGGFGLYAASTTLKTIREEFKLEDDESESGPVNEGLARLVAASAALHDPLWQRMAELVRGPALEIIALAEELLRKFPDDSYMMYFKAYYQNKIGLHDEAVQTLLKAYRPNLDSSAKFTLTIAQLQFLIDGSKSETAQLLCEETIANDTDLKRKTAIIDALVSFHLYSEKLQDLDRLERWAHRGIELDQKNSSLKATLGGVVVEAGRYAEAEPLLVPRIESGPHHHNQAYALYYVARIRAAEGKSNEARNMIERATILSDAEWLRRRVQKLLAALEPST
jgi:hypothetical protein